MGRHLVKEYMTPDPVRISPGNTVYQAIESMDYGPFRHLPVVDENDNLMGIISDRDLRNFETALKLVDAAEAKRLQATPVEQFMSKSVIIVDESEELVKAAVIMNESQVGALPVLHGKQLTGIISYSDILKAFIETY